MSLDTSLSRAPARLRAAAGIGGAAVAGIGAVVLLGWAAGLDRLKSLSPAWVSMKPNTALGLVLAGATLFLAAGAPGRRRSLGVRLGAAATALIGALTLAEYLLGVDFGIDQLLFRDDMSGVGTSVAGRMAPNSAAGFILAGSALWLLAARRRAADAPALLLAAIASLAVIGYLYGVESFYGFAAHTRMALHTALAFLLLAAGVMAAEPRLGATAILLAPGPGGLLARRLLPAALALPAGLGWLIVRAQRAGLLTPPLDAAVFAVAAIAALAALVAVLARSLENLDAKRRSAEDANAAEARTLEAVLDSIGEGVVVADTRGAFLRWNPAAERIIGIGPRAVPAERWSDAYGVFRPDKTTPYPADALPLTRAVRGESTDDDEQFLRNPGVPEGRFVSVTGRPLRGPDGTLLGGVVSVRDVSREKADEAKLLELNRQLESFSYSVSHDLRAPLRHVDGFIDLLGKKLGDHPDEQVRRYMTTIARAARRMGALIDDLLSFSRMQRTEPRRGAVDPAVLLKRVRRELAPEYAGRDVEWRVAELPPLDGDGEMLRLVFQNLLANALKFTRTRERAIIEVGPADAERPGRVVIRVRDNGVGFDDRYSGKLFGVFQRLHRQDEFEGTGIGLANVKQIVERHGGEVWAESKLGAGAAFYVALPEHNGGSRASAQAHPAG